MKGHFGVNNQSGGNGDCNEEGGHPSKVSYGSTIATEAFYDENWRNNHAHNIWIHAPTPSAKGLLCLEQHEV